MIDVTGTTILVGDVVFFGNTSRYATFGLGEVVRDTRKTVVVKTFTASRREDVGTEVRIRMPEHIIIINNDTKSRVDSLR